MTALKALETSTNCSRFELAEFLGAVKFNDQGLVPAIAQDSASGAVLMLAWAAWGISLAVKRGHLGERVDWVGFTFTLRPARVITTVLAARLEEIRQLADSIAGHNVVSFKQLRTFVGKVQSLAPLLCVETICAHVLC